MCSVFPCFSALQWPFYSTKVIDKIDGQPVIIDGYPVVIQLWKGWCQNFLGMDDFPGGIDAEVGVYRRIPGKVKPTSLPFPSPLGVAEFFTKLAMVSEDELWWPVEFEPQIVFTLVNPVTGQTFFRAGPENSFWLAKWMSYDSYSKYRDNHPDANSPDPFQSTDYWLDYKINGYSYQRWS